MVDRGQKAPKALKELAVAQFMANYFAKHSEFPSNDEIIDAMKEEFSEEAVGPLYPKDITNLKRGAYKLLQLEVAQPREEGIEAELRDFLGLEGAMVVGSPYRTYDDAILRNIIGYQAARFFDDNVRDGQTVTLSCSMTMREMIKRIRTHYTGLRVFADSVVAVSQFHIMSPASLVVLFLDRFPECRGTAYTSTPALVEMLGRDACQRILDKEIFDAAFHADWVFVGIGALTRRLSTQGLTPGFDFLTHVVTHDAESLYHRGVVGEISYWPFDERGKPVFAGADEDLNLTGTSGATRARPRRSWGPLAGRTRSGPSALRPVFSTIWSRIFTRRKPSCSVPRITAQNSLDADVLQAKIPRFRCAGPPLIDSGRPPKEVHRWTGISSHLTQYSISNMAGEWRSR